MAYTVDSPSARATGGSREQIVLVAERLFGERGISAVSMREIAAAAGQGNTSAVRYNFGSKQGLVDAIFLFRMDRIDQRRRAMLAEMALTRPEPDAEFRLLLQALIYPLAEFIGHENGASWYVRFLRLAVFAADFEMFAPPRNEVTKGLKAVMEGLERHLGHVPEILRRERVPRASQSVVHALADQEALISRGQARITTSLLAADLVDTTTAMLQAPVSSPPTTTLDTYR